MKSSIDLTSGRDFRDNHIQSFSISNKFRHKKVPWKRVGEDECSPIGYDDSFVINNNTIFNTRTNSLSSTITWSTYDTDMIFNINMYDLNDVDNIIDYYNYNKHYKKIANDKHGDFVLGHKKDIVKASENRNPIKNQSKYASMIGHCKKCGSRLNCKINEKGITYSDCSNCNNQKEKIEVYYDSDLKFIWDTEKLQKMKRIHLSRHQPKQVGYIPCISSNIPMEKQKRQNPYRFIEWYTYMDKYVSVEDSKKLESLYTKNQTLGRRQEPWQPNGRIRQSYDSLFENIHWKDLLKYRLGILDRDNLLTTDKRNVSISNISSQSVAITFQRNSRFERNEFDITWVDLTDVDDDNILLW